MSHNAMKKEQNSYLRIQEYREEHIQLFCALSLSLADGREVTPLPNWLRELQVLLCDHLTPSEDNLFLVRRGHLCPALPVLGGSVCLTHR